MTDKRTGVIFFSKKESSVLLPTLEVIPHMTYALPLKRVLELSGSPVRAMEELVCRHNCKKIDYTETLNNSYTTYNYHGLKI